MASSVASAPPPPPTAALSSRSSSSSSTGSTDSSYSDLVGQISSTSPVFTDVFTAPPAATSSSASPDTPPISRTPSPDDFDDERLPARTLTSTSSRSRSRSHAAVATGDDAPPTADPGIPVKLEKVPGGKKKYVLRLDEDLRTLLEAQMAERKANSGDDKKPTRRRRFGDLVFTQRFSAFDRANPENAKSPYHGFFVLIWLGVFILMLKTAAENYRARGRIFDIDILAIMFEPNQLTDCLLTDTVIFYGCTLWCVPLQRAVASGKLSWNRSGWILQTVWQALYLGGVIGYILYKDWRWIQSVFIVLHCIVILMKQHSYAFYNGYLSEVHKRRSVLTQKLAQLQDAGADAMPTAHSTALDPALDACDAELTSTSPSSDSSSETITYPANLTHFNFLEYLHFPTVVYELTYPRQASINWYYVAEKAGATFGVLGIMIVVSQHWIYPVVMDCNALHALPMSARLSEFPWILLRLIFPFMAEYILVWYLIWELILNLLGELTRFSDRGFYGPWWNSTTWDAFARDWNKPVHAFLLRHVYHSSISTLRISRKSATLITFLLSALVHELVMWCIFKKLRGYLLLAQMGQLPLVALSRTRLLSGRETVGNVMFWVGIWTGPSFLSASYLIL
ncbi:MBOAT, membrane-bound O-acyltransferase family-domain-containing protein [Geopyxis carbonaria]|nr:MBOAT, membrane-bound O-acyltransferase family-domain-containing protein [Geopyxis carbonaria]